MSDAVTKLTLSYNGGAFAGWARQPGLRTVEAELEEALATVLHERVALSVAGRTDRGVHAWGQVASYRHEAVDPARLNSLLSHDVVVLSSEAMSAGFDARRSALRRTYCYRVLNRRAPSPFEHGRAFWVPQTIDREALSTCAELVVGRHDFTAFTPAETHHDRFERHVSAACWHVDGDLLEFWIEADSFMRHMNRALVGTMLEIARGARAIDGFAALLDGRPRGDAGSTAAPCGLYLASVAYEPPTEGNGVTRR